MAELQLDNVTKVFEDDEGEIVAVDDVSLDIDDEEFLVLVGPSGCGKSTTLRMIAGLESVTSGTIRLGDELINDKRPQNRDTAMVFQSYALYPHMTVRGNMAFGLEESTDMSDDEIDQRVTDTAEMMGIEELLDRKPGELSGGQQQRVALGRAIVREPAAFLMDEPLANLDAKLRAQMRTELQRLQEDLGVTTIYVTHDQTEAMTMGDRIAILNDGVLQQVGTPLECYHEPANQFVAGFIGEPSMNFFEMELEDGRLVGENFDYELTDEHREAIDGTERVVLGIRPEDIVVDNTDDDTHTYAVTIDVVEPKGDENNVHLTFDPDDEEPETFVATVGGMRRVAAGDRVDAEIPSEAIHLFDARTGDALHNRSMSTAEQSEFEF
ncbi:ABC transporter ATP-binding protein [Halapricum desulfuricans]|uniref:ABC-type D-xylose/L-arabinose transporter n=1 Tax=Halapricum desulfuricans TaxID=2841257 RepID=A0A897NNY6_9EURY|nr:sn-glycerol-3-phosphate ABC transporter ATP-binding protein UgpC [Halapricum desulfuricans]QSG16240.1 ABC-type spermidine/putrescine transport system,ATPase component [Halapricum desulfuricans]